MHDNDYTYYKKVSIILTIIVWPIILALSIFGAAYFAGSERGNECAIFGLISGVMFLIGLILTIKD